MSYSPQEQLRNIQEPGHGEDDAQEKPEDGLDVSDQALQEHPWQTHGNLENVQEPGHGEDDGDEKAEDALDVSDHQALQEQPPQSGEFENVQESGHVEDEDELDASDHQALQEQPPGTGKLENVQGGRGEDDYEEKPKDGPDVSDQAILQQQPRQAEKSDDQKMKGPLLHIDDDSGQPQRQKQIKLGGGARTKFDTIKSHAYLDSLVNDRVYQEKFDDAILDYDDIELESPFVDNYSMQGFISDYLELTDITIEDLGKAMRLVRRNPDDWKIDAVRARVMNRGRRS